MTIAVSASSDDARQSYSDSVNLTSSHLQLIHDTSDQTVGTRFAGVNILQGVTIVNASIQFTMDATSTDATALTIQAQASDNAPTFTATSNNISCQARTMASVSWNPVA